MSGQRRLLIIGLDGATFDLIDPWIAQGELPHIAALIRRGLRAHLESTLPPVTFPAWSSFMTGKNPGQHGLYDFIRLKPGTYHLEFVGARSRRGSTIWRMLSDAGLRLGVMALPATYPPESVNGFMISGFDSPVSTGTDPSFVFPPSLFWEIKERIGPYQITDFQQFRVGRGWHEQALQKTCQTLERKIAIAAYLLGKEPWDLFMVLFGEADTVCHHFWMFHDPDSPRRADTCGDRFRDAILTVYRRLDDAVGQLVSLAGPETAVMLISDHGFGGAGDKVVYLNRWLERAGFLKFRRGIQAKAGMTSVLRSASLKLLPLRLQEHILHRGAGLANALLSQTQLGTIDWSRTRAFSTELNTLPAMWINLRDRQPCGIVSPDQEYESLRDELCDHLAGFLDPDTGQSVVARAYRREELYHGPCLAQAPDLVLDMNLAHGYSYTCLSSSGRGSTRPIRRLTRGKLMGAKGQGMNGSHRREGVFVFANGQEPSGRRRDAVSILDVAPTLLQFFRLPVPSDMDGQAIDEAFADTSAAVRA